VLFWLTFNRPREQSVAISHFGHIGDGNLHYNVLVPLDRSASFYKETTTKLNKQIHDLVTQFNGS
jgi:FAD/FMN-containing dehydrogenase